MAIRRVIPMIGVVAAAGCGSGKGGGFAGDTSALVSDSGEREGDDSGASGEEEQLTATIEGTVTVELYTIGADGERASLSWADATGGVYNFGSIFVTAYYVGDDGADHYVGQTVITSPTTAANPYSMQVQMGEEHDVYVYAVVDYYQDNVVGTNEPKGVWPEAIPLSDGDEVGDIDITILAPPYGAGGSCDTVDITGTDILTDTWAGGDVWTMLVNTSGEGPYHSTSSTPTPSGGGAWASYDLVSCAGYGEMKLVGAWDSNGNGMADPLDKWGAYISGADTDGNPVHIGSSDLSGYDVQIPLGEFGLSIVPFVQISGTVSVQDGTFADLPSGTSVYVAALKFRRSGDFSAAELSTAYDSRSFSPSDLSGESSVEYTLTVPANTIVYLWAYADTDGDGMLNESGEPVASGGTDDSGHFPTGTTSSGGNDLLLATAEEG